MAFTRQLFILTFFALFCHHMVVAGPSVHLGAAPSWITKVKMNDSPYDPRDISDGTYLKLFEEEINIAADETYKHIVEEIISDAGVQSASNISITFNPAYEQLTVHNVTVVRDGKPINKLRKDAFKVLANEKELDMFVYNGEYSAYLILPDVRKGDRIEFDYTIAGSNPIFNKKFFRTFEFHRAYPVSQLHYSILAPTARTLNFRYFNNAPKETEQKAGNATLYDWNLLNVKPSMYGDNMPVWYEPFPYAQISEYKGWNEVADWAYKINMPNSALNAVLNERISQLKAKYLNDTPGLFRAIVSIVQNDVRYMGIELGTYSHKANDPCKVYDQRYGDCKDKSLLLVSMLQRAGIPAEMALVHSSSRGAIARDLPFPSSFNHAIAVAHLAGRDIWVDPTIAFQGGSGTDLYFPNYGKALVLKPGTDSLTTIPEKQGGYVKYTEEYTVSNVDSPVTLVIRTTYYGHMADNTRYGFANQSKTDMEKSYLDYYSRIFSHIRSADTVITTDDMNADSIQTIEKYTVTNFYEYDSSKNSYSASFYCYMIRDKLPKVDNDKQYPISVDYPYRIRCSIRVHTPNGWQIDPVSERIFRDAYHFSYDASATDNVLSLDHELVFMKDHISTDNIAQYETDRKKIAGDYLSYTITHTKETDNKNDNTDTATSNFIGKYLPGLATASFIGLLIYRNIRRRRQR